MVGAFEPPGRLARILTMESRSPRRMRSRPRSTCPRTSPARSKKKTTRDECLPAGVVTRGMATTKRHYTAGDGIWGGPMSTRRHACKRCDKRRMCSGGYCADCTADRAAIKAGPTCESWRHVGEQIIATHEAVGATYTVRNLCVECAGSALESGNRFRWMCLTVRRLPTPALAIAIASEVGR